jgi:hypothetical protein
MLNLNKIFAVLFDEDVLFSQTIFSLETVSFFMHKLVEFAHYAPILHKIGGVLWQKN